MSLTSNRLLYRRSDFQDFGGAFIARRIDVLKDGGLAMKIVVTGVVDAGQISAKEFVVQGHEWTRAFTDEVQ